MRRPPPPHRRGEPKTPGSGRRRGSLNRRTVELRALMTALAGDVDYQYRLRQDFRRRRVHPSIEALVWAHTIGKPPERVQLSADLTMNQKLAEECAVFARLDVSQMEELVAASQALIDRMMEMANANGAMREPSASPRALAEAETINVPPRAEST
jgi:hypothetical protein